MVQNSFDIYLSSNNYIFLRCNKRFRNDMKLKFGQKMFEFNISAEPFKKYIIKAFDQTKMETLFFVIFQSLW